MESQKPILGKIALSLSGGGYRAAAFHLGTLEMLNDLGLLKDVKVLSTVSGGSIVGAFYVVSLADGLSFDSYRDKFYDFLKSTNVILSSLNGLDASRAIACTPVMPSLIRAASDVYDGSNLLGGKRFSDLTQVQEHLDEIVINATEFRAGGSFRFVSSTNPNVCSGNNSAEIDDEVAGKIRIADAVAASSCFPSGFEPIRFPSDFVWPENEEIALIRKLLGNNFKDEIPLMDGGIFDNQGIDSIKNIHSRKNSDIGLFIISDTSARRSKGFEFPIAPLKGTIPLWVWRLLLVVLAILSALSAVAIVVEAAPFYLYGSIGLSRGIFLYLLPILFSLSILFLLIYGWYRVRQLAKLARDETGIHLWSYLKHLTLPEVIALLSGRVKSVIEMTTNVFMKRVRALGFEGVFADLGLREKLVPNIIYDIDNEQRWGKEIKEAGHAPKSFLREVAKRAESYGTNLWFLEPSDLDNLIHCGRATICFKLLKYLLRYKKGEIENASSPEKKLFDLVVSTWSKLNADGRAHDK